MYYHLIESIEAANSAKEYSDHLTAKPLSKDYLAQICDFCLRAQCASFDENSTSDFCYLYNQYDKRDY